MTDEKKLETYLKAALLDINGKNELSAPESSDLVFVYDVITAVLEGRYNDAKESIKPASTSQARSIRAFVNREILFDRKREWTSHAINRSFRFWSASEKVDYLRFAQDVVEVLKMRYMASLGYGSVLSLIRDNDLIPHDDDLDVIVAIKSDDGSVYNHELAQLEKFIQNSGFTTRGEYPNLRHVSNGKFMLDVFLGIQSGDTVSWHPGPRDVIAASDIFPTKNYKLFGIGCSIPREPEKYLSLVYGPDWRTPISGWTHDFNPAPYADWFWPKKKT